MVSIIASQCRRLRVKSPATIDLSGSVWVSSVSSTTKDCPTVDERARGSGRSLFSITFIQHQFNAPFVLMQNLRVCPAETERENVQPSVSAVCV